MKLSELHIDVSLVNPAFIAGMLLIAALRLITPGRWHIALGTVFSAVLIGLGSWPTLAMIGGMTMLVIFPMSRMIAACRETAPAMSRVLLGIGIAVILCGWTIFKLNREIELPWMQGTGLSKELLTLVGYSYFIFRGINILYMHYLMGEVPNATPLRMLFFAIFPATLTSGPIQKYPDFCRQAATPVALDVPTIAAATERITRGYFYKICIAPVLQQASDHLLAINGLQGYHSLAIMALMYIFVFFDFAGYSHIAIGFGLLLGIKVPENFRQPFLATSITEFWRNWHISIGDWFRDHIFIPWGGMRLGGIRAAVFAATIMLLCGLWHGFTALFVAWGVWHASNLFFEGIAGVKPMPPAERHGPRFWARVLWTNSRIAFGALFFLKDWTAAKPVFEGFARWW